MNIFALKCAYWHARSLELAYLVIAQDCACPDVSRERALEAMARGDAIRVHLPTASRWWP